MSSRPRAQGQFPLVVGGDCAVLLGALAGLRRSGPLSLVHVDGHSDFRHPGNYDARTMLSAVAGMDLALATGRGDPLMTAWPGVPAPLVPDAQVVQIGEREGREPGFVWADVNDTAFNRIDVFEARKMRRRRRRGERTSDRRASRTGRSSCISTSTCSTRTIMPAVDSPGSPGIDPDQLRIILSRLIADPRCAGMTVTIFDPDLDPDGSLAAWLVSLPARCLRREPR